MQAQVKDFVRSALWVIGFEISRHRPYLRRHYAFRYDRDAARMLPTQVVPERCAPVTSMGLPAATTLAPVYPAVR